MNTQTGGEIAATDKNPAAVHADGYVTRDIRPASRENRKPDGDDRDNGGYDHREIAPRDTQETTMPCVCSFLSSMLRSSLGYR